MKWLLALTLLTAGCDARRALRGRVAGELTRREDAKKTYEAHVIEQPVGQCLTKRYLQE